MLSIFLRVLVVLSASMLFVGCNRDQGNASKAEIVLLCNVISESKSPTGEVKQSKENLRIQINPDKKTVAMMAGQTEPIKDFTLTPTNVAWNIDGKVSQGNANARSRAAVSIGRINGEYKADIVIHEEGGNQAILMTFKDQGICTREGAVLF